MRHDDIISNILIDKLDVTLYLELSDGSHLFYTIFDKLRNELTNELFNDLENELRNKL